MKFCFKELSHYKLFESKKIGQQWIVTSIRWTCGKEIAESFFRLNASFIVQIRFVFGCCTIGVFFVSFYLLSLLCTGEYNPLVFSNGSV